MEENQCLKVNHEQLLHAIPGEYEQNLSFPQTKLQVLK
jgi:hypothetical protein